MNETIERTKPIALLAQAFVLVEELKQLRRISKIVNEQASSISNRATPDYIKKLAATDDIMKVGLQKIVPLKNMIFRLRDDHLEKVLVLTIQLHLEEAALLGALNDYPGTTKESMEKQIKRLEEKL